MKNSQKGFAPLVLIIIVIAVAVIAGGGAVYYKNRSASVLSVEIKTSSTNQASTDGRSISDSNTKDCGKSSEILEEGKIIKSFDCLIESAKTCIPTKADITTTIDLARMFQPLAGGNKISNMIQTQRTFYEIKGMTNGKCVYFTKLLDVQNKSMPAGIKETMLREGEMTCSYPSAELVVRLKNVQNGNTSTSFNSSDTPEQKALKQCESFGAPLEDGTTFSPKPTTQQTLTPSNSVPRTMSYDVTVDGSVQRQRAFGNRSEIAFEVENIRADSVDIVIFNKAGEFVKAITLKPSQSAIVLNRTIELKSIESTQIVLKITETY